jgi:hypothetical protein
MTSFNFASTNLRPLRLPGAVTPGEPSQGNDGPGRPPFLVANLENVEIAFAAWSAVQRSRRAERSMRRLRGCSGLRITKAGGRS